MVVSRFVEIPILMNLSEKDWVGPIPLGPKPDPGGVGGYMRKRNFWLQLRSQELAHSAAAALAGLTH